MRVIQLYVRALQKAASADTLAELLMHLDFADSLAVPPSVIKRTRALRERVMERWDELERREYAQYLYNAGDEYY